MKQEKLYRFGVIVGTLVVMNTFRGWFLFNIIMSIFASIAGDNTITYITASITTTIVVGIGTMLPLYWGLRENHEERRRFLTYFAEHDYNRANLNVYIKEVKIVKQDTIVFLIALIVVLIFRFAEYLFYSSSYLIDVILEFSIIFGIFLLFNYFIRKKLYDKWEAERLHK